MVILRDSNKYSEIKKIGSGAMMGDFPLGQSTCLFDM